MCSSCVIAVGAFVGAVAMAKSGRLGSAKTAVVAFAAQVLFLRARR